MASKVSRLIEYPSTNSTKQTPTSESGIVTIGINTDRNDPRKSRITTTTMSAASPIVLNTSSIEAEMKFEAS